MCLLGYFEKGVDNKHMEWLCLIGDVGYTQHIKQYIQLNIAED